MRAARPSAFLAALACAALVAGCSGGSSGNAPKNACQNSCSRAGQTQCLGEQVQTCVQDANGCLAFGAATACEGGGTCSAASNACTRSASASWTVLVYVAADNTLEPEAIFNLEQMAKVGSSSDLNLVVEVDRGLEYSTDPIGNITWTKPSAKRLLVEQGQFEELEDLGPIDSGTVEALQDFVQWGVHNYPAQHVALILWDHGGSWEGGYGYDDSQGGHFSIDDVKQAVTDGLSGTAVSKLDLLGFDACLMASLEVLDQLEGLTDF